VSGLEPSLLFDELSSTAMPAPGESVRGRISYHVRSGGHVVEDIDWERYLDFLDHWMGKTQSRLTPLAAR
jgi:hypothetical protein